MKKLKVKSESTENKIPTNTSLGLKMNTFFKFKSAKAKRQEKDGKIYTDDDFVNILIK